MRMPGFLMGRRRGKKSEERREGSEKKGMFPLIDRPTPVMDKLRKMKKEREEE